MAEKKLDKGTPEWQFFQDFWKFRQKYHDSDGESDDWYEELVKAGDELVEKYKNTDIENFARKLVLSHMEDIELRERKKNKA